MPALRRLESVLLFAIFALLSVNAITKLVGLTKLYRTPPHPKPPKNGDVWSVDRPPVAFMFDAGIRRYTLNATAEWAALVPGDGLVRLGPAREPFSVAMLHQLRCLDIMRAQLTVPRARRAEQPVRHCMNYIKQMILCRGDTHLDPYQYPSNIHPVDSNPIRRCLDWRAVYEAVERNQREYAASAVS